ncbi:hypothetical protein PFISCL1PPCAC_3003, partial [Pristionchus fissidentatus]
IPAAPIFGAISSALRGESTLTVDQFYAYRNTLFLNVILAVGGAFLTGAVVIRFYERDANA